MFLLTKCSDEPGYGYDVYVCLSPQRKSITNETVHRYVQRLSVYVQIKDGLAKQPSEVDLKDPYSIVKKWKKELSTNGNITSAPFREKMDDSHIFDNGKNAI